VFWSPPRFAAIMALAIRSFSCKNRQRLRPGRWSRQLYGIEAKGMSEMPPEYSGSGFYEFLIPRERLIAAWVKKPWGSRSIAHAPAVAIARGTRLNVGGNRDGSHLDSARSDVVQQLAPGNSARPFSPAR